jgi:ferredoxin
MKGSVAEVIDEPVPTQAERACRETVESCPVAAITITE